MPNAYPSVPSSVPPRDDASCAPGTQSYGQPGIGQPSQFPQMSQPQTVVTHVQYPPAPVPGVPVPGHGYYPSDAAPRYPPGQGGQQLRMPDGTTLVVTADPGSVQYVIARSYARAVRLFSVVDALIIVLYVVSGFYYAAVALLGPICGYHGARAYMRPHTLPYVIFCFINLCWRTAVFIMSSTVASQVLGFLMVVVEVYITRLAVQFYKILKTFSEEDLRMLRAMDTMPARMVYW